jgi:cyclic dehypoxanthinyl futalosine synthase
MEDKALSHIKGARGWKNAPTLSKLLMLQNDWKQGLNTAQRNLDSQVPTLNSELFQLKLGNMDPSLLRTAYEKAWLGHRLNGAEGLELLERGDLHDLGMLATRMKNRFHDNQSATYLLDRNINYTNICRIGCDFCAFYRRDGHEEAYVLPNETIFAKIEETVDLGGTGVLMQGGVNPKLKIEYYETLFQEIKQRFNIHLHALSVIEIEGIAKVSRLSVEETLARLKSAGLDSIPGAGAEILSDEIRLNQSPVKRHSHRWIDVMQMAHKLDLPTTATMMFGALEENKHIIEHIERIRTAQDETGGFYSFIMWTFQGENTDLLKENPNIVKTTAVEYFKVLAVSRLMMDNIPNIQGSWVTMGPKVGQTSLHFGANDMGSIMIEENVVSAAGTAHHLDESMMRQLIESSGFIAQQRDTYYRWIS